MKFGFILRQYYLCTIWHVGLLRAHPYVIIVLGPSLVLLNLMSAGSSIFRARKDFGN